MSVNVIGAELGPPFVTVEEEPHGQLGRRARGAAVVRTPASPWTTVTASPA